MNTAKRVTVMMLVFAFCHVAAAQGYVIRVDVNANLRSGPGLDYGWVETALAGTQLQVVGQHNRWLRIDRSGREVWMADWLRYSRVEGGAAPASQPVSNIDNCCFVDRQCASDQDWSDGYWAFQNGQCAAPVQTGTGTSTQPVTSTPATVDNCCFVDRQCHNDAEWADGYWAFQNGQCGSPAQSQPQASGLPGIRIEGSPGFVAQFNKSLELLRDRSPQWYTYVTNGINLVRQDLSRSSVAVYIESKTMVSNYGDQANPAFGEEHYFRIIQELIHEACHSNRWHAGIWFDEGWRNELPCHETTLEAMTTINPDSLWIAWDQRIIENYRAYQTWWGPGDPPV